VINQENMKTTSAYLSGLSEKELKGYEIAKSHLGLYFHLESSNGYVRFSPSSFLTTTTKNDFIIKSPIPIQINDDKNKKE
jgi:hypothetical protein